MLFKLQLKKIVVTEIYTDGSFYKKIPIWAYVVVQNGKKIAADSGTLGGEIVRMQQIGGELYAVIQAVQWAKWNKTQIWIVHDYEGIREWVADIWGGRAWNTNNRWAEEYKQFIHKNKSWILGMRSVRSHTGVFWNEEVDAEARKTLDSAGLVNHRIW